jgi:hypothetical protein
MIPLSMKEFVEYTDTDGIVFRFKPKGAILEREQMDIWKEGETVEQYRDKLDTFIDRILILPLYPQCPSKIFNSEEKIELLRMWNEANKLTKEQKKN